MAEDWIARSRREAVVLLAESRAVITSSETYDAIVEVVASAYCVGAIHGLERAMTLIKDES